MKRSPIGNTELISILNNRLVMRAVRVMQPTFRADIARRTGLKPATVTAIVNSLLRRRMLREVASRVQVRAGRPPMMLEVNAGAGRIIAIELQPARLRAAVTDLMARLLKLKEQSIDPEADPQATLKLMTRLARTMMRSNCDVQLLGVGVSAPGMIDYASGTILDIRQMPRWRDIAIVPTLSKTLGTKVCLERSIHLRAMHHAWLDPRLHAGTTVVLHVDDGDAQMSLLHRGRFARGGNGLWGELGHTVIDVDGRPCTCGGRGCLNTFLTNGSVAQTGQYLGVAVTNLINLFAPDYVVIDGVIDSAKQTLLNAVREQVNAQALPQSREAATIEMAAEDPHRSLLGAAVLVAQEVFEPPELAHHV